jgi:hypothetical protein
MDQILKGVAAPVSSPVRGRATGGEIRRRPMATAMTRQAALSEPERVLLRALVRGGEAARIFDEWRGELPPKQSLADLFEHQAARDWMTGVLSQAPDFSSIRLEPALASDPGLDPDFRSFLIEAWMGEEQEWDAQTFRGALERQNRRCWARFSQQIKAELAAAEANKDAGLREKLLKDYLDVQRKMKEFTSFYDEA